MFTQDELSQLDKRSIENMLIFYEEEMRHVAGGEGPSTFLTKPLIKRFVALGLLERNWGNQNRKVTLSQKGRDWYNRHAARLP